MLSTSRLVRWPIAALVAALLLQMTVVVGLAAPVAAVSVCASDSQPTTDQAKAEFAQRCGRAWNDQARDQCTWVADPAGWVCHEYAEGGFDPADADDPEPPEAASARVATPRFIQAEWANGYVNVVWSHLGGPVDGVNIYRDDQYVGTVTDGTVYNDFSGRPDSVYHLVGFKDGNFSNPSADFSASSGVDVALAVTDQGNGFADVAWIVSGYPPGQVPYRSLYRIIPDRDGGARAELARDTRGLHTTSGVAATVPTIGQGDLYFVVIQHGGDMVAVSGVHTLDNACVANCDGDALTDRGVTSRARRPSRAEIIRQIVESVDDLIRRCLSTGCDSVIRDAADHFMNPDPAEVAGGNTVADLEQDGWSISDQDGDSTTLTRGEDTRVITAEPGSGVVTDHEVHGGGPNGAVTQVSVTTTTVSNDPYDDGNTITTGVQTTVVNHNINWYDGTRLGSYVETWRDGRLISRDCYGNASTSSCTTQHPLNGPTTPDDDEDSDFELNGPENNWGWGDDPEGEFGGTPTVDDSDYEDPNDEEEEEEEEEEEPTPNPHTR